MSEYDFNDLKYSEIHLSKSGSKRSNFSYYITLMHQNHQQCDEVLKRMHKLLVAKCSLSP